MAREIELGAGLARGADRGKAAHVARAQRGEGRVLALCRSQHPVRRGQHRRIAVVQPGFQEHPAAFLALFRQPRLAQDADMARDARLALAQHFRQFAHRQLHARQQAQQAQARRIVDRAQQLDKGRGGGHG